jgi:SnoaL-like domain
MPALVAGIYLLQDRHHKEVDGRDKPADGEKILMARDTTDRLAIRALIENWVLWRDARMWDRFRTVWHKDGADVGNLVSGLV